MSYFIELLFSPGIAASIGLSGIGILVGLGDNRDFAILQFLYEYKVLIIILLFIWMVVSFVLDTIIRDKNNTISGLERAIVEKDNQLRETHKLLYYRYGEFAKFAQGVRYEEVLKDFVNKKTIVDSAQIYRITRNKEGKRIIITLNHVKGYCKAGMDINSLLQTKYVLNYDVYKAFRRGVFRKWCRLKNENLRSWEAIELYNSISVSARKIINIIYKRLNKMDRIGIVEDNDFSYYRLLSILSLILTGGDNLITFDDITKDNDVNQYLRKGKRTGVLGAILLEDIFIFSHKGESRKNGRMYVSFYFEDGGNPYVTIFSFTPRNLSEKLGFKEEILELVCDFRQILLEGSVKNA